MDKPKVLHIIKSLGRGGAETVLCELVRIQSKEFEVHCIYFLPWKNEMVGNLEGIGAKVTCMSAGNNIALLSQFRKIARYVEENNIDLVHSHLPWAGFAARLAYRLHGVITLYTEHNKQERYHWLTRLVNRLTFHWQTMVISVSRDVESSIRTNINPTIPVATIVNGVDTARFIRDSAAGARIKQELGWRDNIVVGTVCVFRTQKRLIEWLEVAAGLTATHPQLRFIVVGAGPLEEPIKAWATELGLGPQSICFPGLQRDILPWLSAMDVFMMSSVFEGMPIAMLEAMSAGSAVVSTDAGGVKEIVRDGVDGFLVSVNEWQKLMPLVAALVSDPGKLARVAEAGRARVIAEFSIQKMAIEMISLYQQLIRRQRAEPANH